MRFAMANPYLQLTGNVGIKRVEKPKRVGFKREIEITHYAVISAEVQEGQLPPTMVDVEVLISEKLYRELYELSNSSKSDLSSLRIGGNLEIIVEEALSNGNLGSGGGNVHSSGD